MPGTGISSGHALADPVYFLSDEHRDRTFCTRYGQCIYHFRPDWLWLIAVDDPNLIYPFSAGIKTQNLETVAYLKPLLHNVYLFLFVSIGPVFFSESRWSMELWLVVAIRKCCHINPYYWKNKQCQNKQENSMRALIPLVILLIAFTAVSALAK